MKDKKLPIIETDLTHLVDKMTWDQVQRQVEIESAIIFGANFSNFIKYVKAEPQLFVGIGIEDFEADKETGRISFTLKIDSKVKDSQHV